MFVGYFRYFSFAIFSDSKRCLQGLLYVAMGKNRNRAKIKLQYISLYEFYLNFHKPCNTLQHNRLFLYHFFHLFFILSFTFHFFSFFLIFFSSFTLIFFYIFLLTPFFSTFFLTIPDFINFFIIYFFSHIKSNYKTFIKVRCYTR